MCEYGERGVLTVLGCVEKKGPAFVTVFRAQLNTSNVFYFRRVKNTAMRGGTGTSQLFQTQVPRTPPLSNSFG